MENKGTEQISAAEQNGRGWVDMIAAAYEAHQFCAAGFHHLSQQACNLSREARAVIKGHGFDGSNHDLVGECIEDAMRVAPLELRVRTGWHAPGWDGRMPPEEFEILLSTGGPALRLVGELDDAEPARCWLEIQDWGTPWTRLHCRHEREIDAVRWFACLFYYGEA